MKAHSIFLLIISSYSLYAQEQYCKNASHILQQSANHHDPAAVWASVNFKIHIQEPRTATPQRYSVLTLDKSASYFQLDRNRDNHISSHIVDGEEQSRILWDGGADLPPDDVDKFKLDPKTNFGLKRFYQLMYGLPMSLLQEPMQLNREATIGTFQNQTAYVLEAELQRPMIGKNWRLYFSPSDYTLLGIELYSKEDPTKGERIVFADSVKIKNLVLPRVHHWYTLQKEYLGSDIIVKEVD